MNHLTFRTTSLDLVQRNGQVWLTATQIAQALGYTREDAVSRIYQRKADEFTPSMSQTVKLTFRGLQREQRIFSLRGAHLLAMFSRTPVAKEFRAWVLDILDREVEKQTPTLPRQFEFERWNGSSQLPVQKCALIERRRDGVVTITTSECKLMGKRCKQIQGGHYALT